MRYELLVEIITDAQLKAYEETYDPTEGRYFGTLTPTREMLDTFGEDVVDITYQIADVRTIDRRSSAFSKTISLPDTDHNRRIFDGIHNWGYVDGFNMKRRTKCYILVDTIIVFEGYLQLQDYQFDGANGPSYNVLLSSSLRTFKDSLSNLLLQDLSWDSINEEWTYENVMDTWNPVIKKEVFYPLMDYGWNLKTQLIPSGWGNTYLSATSSASPIAISLFTENFFPAIYLKSYIDRIFSAAGYRYNSDFFNSDLFSSIIVPYNGTEEMLRTDINDAGNGSFASDKYFFVGNDSDFTHLSSGLILPGFDYYFRIRMNDESTGDFDDINGFWNTTLNEYLQYRTDNIYQQKISLFLPIKLSYVSTPQDISDLNPTDISIFSILVCRKSTPFSSASDLGDSQAEYFVYNSDPLVTRLESSWDSTTGYTTVKLEQIYRNESYHDYGFDDPDAPTHLVSIGTGEHVKWMIRIRGGSSGVANGTLIQNEDATLQNEISLNTIYGEIIEIKNVVPKNIRCYDFISNILNVFNLYVEADPEDDTLFNIEPRKDFINSGKTIDWSQKVDLSQQIGMKIIAETQNKLTRFKWNAPTGWYQNDYKTKTGFEYGEYVYSNNNDYSSGESIQTNLFSATPMVIVPGGKDPNSSEIISGSDGIIIPNLVEDIKLPIYEGYPNTRIRQSGIRLLFAVKRMNCVFDPAQAWRQSFFFGIPGYGRQTTGSTTPPFPTGYPGVMDSYPYAGTANDLYTPTFDLNWGSLIATYYSESFGRTYTFNNLVSEYWWDYLEELNARDSRIITLTMKLDARDIADFSFRDKIFVRINHPRLGFSSGAYFLINKISGYNPSTLEPCKVELLLLGKVNAEPAITPTGPSSPPLPGS
jgi:hypothetical protein